MKNINLGHANSFAQQYGFEGKLSPKVMWDALSLSNLTSLVNQNLGGQTNQGGPSASFNFIPPAPQPSVIGNQSYNPPPAPAPSGGGGGNRGGGGSNVNGHINPATGVWDDGYWATHGGAQTADQKAQQEAQLQAQRDAANAAYNPIIDYFNNMAQNVLPGQRQSQLDTTQTDYSRLAGLLPGEQAGLTAPIQQQQNQFNYDTQSALDQAVRAANALQQQSSSQFGGGSSAGQAVSEIAQQEFARQQGGINQQHLQGDLGFAQNFQQVNQFIAQKKNDLDGWYNDTKQKIMDNFQSQISQANQQVGTTTAMRESIKMDALATAQQFQNQLEAMHVDNGNKLSIMQAALGNIGNQQMNPQLLNQVSYQALNGQLPQVAPASQYATAGLNSNLAGGLFGNKDQQQQQGF